MGRNKTLTAKSGIPVNASVCRLNHLGLLASLYPRSIVTVVQATLMNSHSENVGSDSSDIGVLGVLHL
eukprot:1273942-Amphidinium_carterae.1